MSTANSPYLGEIFAYKIAVQEMQHRLNHQYKAIEMAKSAASQILSSASLIVALAGILQIFSGRVDDNYRLWYTLFLATGGIAYFALIVCCIRALSLQDIYMPISPDWDELFETYIAHMDEAEVLRHQLSSYINTIQLNKPIVIRRSQLVNLSSFLLPFVVLILFIASVMPKS